jgi:Saccharopine dehydrogenase NADP binding domain
LKQETTARGGPVDENRYWYEFITPFAKMRVDGLMEGRDGDLTQTENITFNFHWSFAPVFWLLRPLFKKQQKDVLPDDSALLERVYELDVTGFQRLEQELPNVVVYGGDGFFGHFVVEDLLKYSSAQIIVASRHPKATTFHPFETRVRKVESDVNDYVSVLSTIDGAKVVVSCIGPYQGQSLNLLRACMEKHISYVDIADYFLQPIYFGVKAVQFKIGSELDFLNRALSGLRGLRRTLGLRDVGWLLPISKGLIYAASFFGTSQGGVMVEVSGQNHRSMSLSVLAAEHGEVIPALLPSLAAQMLLGGEITYRGIVPLQDWLPRERLLEELTKRHLKMAFKTESTWSECN